MTKRDIYRLREIIEEMRHIKEADTDKTATHDRFIRLFEEGIKICNKNINRMRPLNVSN